MARPTNASREENLKLKEECQHIEQVLNQLEEICSNHAGITKDDITGIGLLVGKLSIRYQNLVNLLGVFDE